MLSILTLEVDGDAAENVAAVKDLQAGDFFRCIQGYSYDQLIGWVDLDLGSSPGWWPIL